VNPRGLDGLFERHRWKNCGDALRQHRLACARRPDKQDVVSPRARHLQRALGGLLPVYIAQVHGILRRLREHLPRVHFDGLKRLRRVHQIHGLWQRLQRKNVHAFHHCSFLGIRFRHGDGLQSKFPGRERRRQRPAHRPHASVQREFSKEHALVELLPKKLSHASGETERHGKIEPRSFLPHIGRRQINRHALPVGKLVPAISQRALDAFPALFHRVIRQPHHVEVLHPRRAHVHLHLDDVGVNPVDRSTERLEEHGGCADFGVFRA